MANIASILIVLFALSLWFYEHSSTRSVQKFNIVLWTLVLHAFAGSWLVFYLASARTPFYNVIQGQEPLTQSATLLAVTDSSAVVYNDSLIMMVSLPEGDIHHTQAPEIGPGQWEQITPCTNGFQFIYRDSTTGIYKQGFWNRDWMKFPEQEHNEPVIAQTGVGGEALEPAQTALLDTSGLSYLINSGAGIANQPIPLPQNFDPVCQCYSDGQAIFQDKDLNTYALTDSGTWSPILTLQRACPNHPNVQLATSGVYSLDGPVDFRIPTTPIRMDENGNLVMRQHYLAPLSSEPEDQALASLGITPVWQLHELHETMGNEGVMALDSGFVKIRSRFREGEWLTQLQLLNNNAQPTDTVWLEFFPQLPPIQVGNEIVILGDRLDRRARFDARNLTRMDGNGFAVNVIRRLEAKYGKAEVIKTGIALALVGMMVILLMILAGRWLPFMRKAVVLKKIGLAYLAVGVPAVLRLAATLWDLGV